MSTAWAGAMTLGRSLFSGAVVALFFALSVSNAAGAAGDYDRRDDLTKAVVSCEEAYLHLEKCCPGYSASRDDATGSPPCLDREWRETHEGCMGPSSVDTGDSEPLSLHESQCIRGMSCDDLVASGVCARAMNDSTNQRESRPATRGLCP